MKDKIKKQIEGITLIALVITIIVLLILSAIAINLSIGNNGMISKTKNTTEAYIEADQKEENFGEYSCHADDTDHHHCLGGWGSSTSRVRTALPKHRYSSTRRMCRGFSGGIHRAYGCKSGGTSGGRAGFGYKSAGF